MRARGAADFRFASALNANIFLPLFYFGGAFRSHSVFSPPNGNFKSITTCLHVEALKGALKPSIPNNCNLKLSLTRFTIPDNFRYIIHLTILAGFE